MNYNAPLRPFKRKVDNNVSFDTKQDQVGYHFYRASYASTVLAVIVCLSVCLSVRLPSDTSRSCTKIAKPRITLTTSYDSPGTLAFWCKKNLGEIPTRSPPTGAPNRGGVGSNRQFSMNISLYLRNGER